MLITIAIIEGFNLNLKQTYYNKFFMEKKITGALIVAAGKGIRSRSIVPKQYLQFGNKTVLQKNIENFIHEPLIDFVQIVILIFIIKQSLESSLRNFYLHALVEKVDLSLLRMVFKQ